jgi:hypothetical protein
VYVLLSTYTAHRLSQICGGLHQTRKTPTLYSLDITVYYVKLR